MSYKLGTVILSVRDLQQSKAFYSQKLGQPVLKQMSDDHFIVIALANGCLIGLTPHQLIFSPSPVRGFGAALSRPAQEKGPGGEAHPRRNKTNTGTKPGTKQ